MSSVLDDVFDLIPEVVSEYVDHDSHRKVVRVRANDGRIVSLYFSPGITAEGIRSCRPGGSAGWFGIRSWTPTRRWVALASIHIDESINAIGRSHATAYMQVEGGFDPAP